MLLVLVVMLQYFPDAAATVTAGQGYRGVCILIRIFTPQVLAVFQGILLVLFQIIPRCNLIACYFHRSGIIQFFMRAAFSQSPNHALKAPVLTCTHCLSFKFVGCPFGACI